MHPDKLYALAVRYGELWPKITPQAIDPRTTVSEHTTTRLMAHSKYLAIELQAYARDPERYGEAAEALGIIQTLLSVVGWYTLEQLHEHRTQDVPKLSTHGKS